MMPMRDWNELSLTEKINVLPERHPYPVKCMLYLAFNVCPVPWKFVHAVLGRMGYVQVRDEEDLGNGVTRVTSGWTRPESPETMVDP